MDEKAKILIVEDERIIAREMQHKLESMGYDVPAIVSSEEEAIKKAEELHPDLVLMDIIPQKEVDGVKAAGQIRARFDIPVVYVTANVSDARLEDIKRSEPFGCLFKPFEDVELHAAIGMALHRFKMEKKLRESEKKFRTIIESIEDGYYEVDLAGRFTFFNEALRRMADIPTEKLMGMSDLEYAEPKTAKKLYKTFNEVYRTGKPADVQEYEMVKRDGSKRVLEFNAVLMRDEKGEPAGFRGIARDVTKRKDTEEELRNSEERYRLLAENAADVIWTMGMDMRFTYVSPSIFDLAGYTPEEFMDMSFDRYVLPASLELVYRVYEEELALEASGKADPDRTRALEIEITNKDGSAIWVEMKISPLRDRDCRVIGVLGASRDITDRKRMEGELEQSYENLRRGLNATINVLVAAVEMRDPYTAGHQKHVANLARAIATEMGIPKEKIEGIRMAGTIHDIGKISVPPELLSKPGSLKDIEFGMIKLHPQVGYDILKNIEFPWPVALIVLQHHERMDGSGYPQGLSGEEICLEARIMAVADVVDAMSSHRPYRPAIGIEKALKEISQNKGTLYDPEAVDACVRLFTEKGFKLK